jgi:hypothetical protein
LRQDFPVSRCRAFRGDSSRRLSEAACGAGLRGSGEAGYPPIRRIRPNGPESSGPHPNPGLVPSAFRSVSTSTEAEDERACRPLPRRAREARGRSPGRVRSGAAGRTRGSTSRARCVKTCVPQPVKDLVAPREVEVALQRPAPRRGPSPSRGGAEEAPRGGRSSSVRPRTSPAGGWRSRCRRQ